MAWPPLPATDSYSQQQAATVLAALQGFYDPCSDAAFPFMGTVVQTVSLRTAIDSGAIPVSLTGVLTWLSYNKMGAAQRPPEVQANFTAAFVSGPSQIEQRATNAGQTNAQELGPWLTATWMAERIAAGEKACYLSGKGWSQAQGVAYWNQLATQYAASFPSGTFTSGDQPILYVPGIQPQVNTPDDPRDGGFGDGWTVGGEGPPSSMVRPDDRFYFGDGTVRDAQGTVVGTFEQATGNPIAGAVQPVATHYTPVPVNDGTNGSARDPEGSYTEPVPVMNGDDPVPVLNRPAPGGGGPTGGPLPTSVTVDATGGTNGPGGAPVTTTATATNALTRTTLGLPLWAWLAAAAVIAFKRKG